MKWSHYFWVGILGLVTACQSKIDRELREINSFYQHVRPALNLDSLPSNADSLLWEFALQNPKHPQSDTFAYQSIQIKLAKNLTLKAAQWAEVFLETFKNSRNHRVDLYIMSAHYYEQHEVYDRALAQYEAFVNEFPDHEMAPQAKQMIVFIKKGLVTPEQQLEYLLQNSQNASPAESKP